jgi:hypothetical protein
MLDYQVRVNKNVFNIKLGACVCEYSTDRNIILFIYRIKMSQTELTTSTAEARPLDADGDDLSGELGKKKRKKQVT